MPRVRTPAVSVPVPPVEIDISPERMAQLERLGAAVRKVREAGVFSAARDLAAALVKLGRG